jgi:uncharacterized membrane protein
MRYSIGLLAVLAAACTSQSGNNNAGNIRNGTNAAVPVPPVNTAAEANDANMVGSNGAGTAATAMFQASGTEPFWLFTISNGQMLYSPADGTPHSVPAPPSTVIANGFEFATPTLTARFTNVPCTEASGDVVPYTVQVIVGGQTLHGCGA